MHGQSERSRRRRRVSQFYDYCISIYLPTVAQPRGGGAKGAEAPPPRTKKNNESKSKNEKFNNLKTRL